MPNIETNYLSRSGLLYGKAQKLTAEFSNGVPMWPQANAKYRMIADVFVSARLCLLYAQT